MFLCLVFAMSTSPFGLPIRSYDRRVWQERLPELRRQFGRNKKLPAAYELEVLIALSHYPTLAEAHIDFRLTQKRVPASSRPRIGSLFCSRKTRRYLINLSESEVWGDSKVILRNQSFDARIGLIGHELAHTVDYHDTGFWGFFRLGFRLISERGRARFERETDRRAIAHGLGWQLHRWAVELREGISGPTWLDKHYLTPAEIEKALEGKTP